MKAWCYTDETGRILISTTDEGSASDEMMEFEFPEDFDFYKQDQYLIVDGVLKQSPRPPTEAELEAQAERERQEILSLLPDAVAELSDTISTNETATTELADAIAELSAIVAELAATE